MLYVFFPRLIVLAVGLELELMNVNYFQ